MVNTWIQFWNYDPQPFVWAINAHDITAEVRRGKTAFENVTKSATHRQVVRAGGKRSGKGQGRPALGAVHKMPSGLRFFRGFEGVFGRGGVFAV